MHQVKFIHIICTEPRIQEIYSGYLVKNHLFGCFDTIEYENPILDFLNQKKLGGMIKRIKTYQKLHGVDAIVLFDHFDCGAYKLGGYEFINNDEEVKVHQKNNEKVIEIIKKKFPDMEVAVKYIAINPTGNCTWWTPGREQ